jgi:hypothetical protein
MNECTNGPPTQKINYLRVCVEEILSSGIKVWDRKINEFVHGGHI